MFFIRLHLELLGAVCCFVSAAPLRIGCFVTLPAVLGFVRALPFCVVGPPSWAGSPSYSAQEWTCARFVTAGRGDASPGCHSEAMFRWCEAYTSTLHTT